MSQSPKNKHNPKKNVTRREFVSSTAALGTGIALASNPLKAFASPSKKEDLNIAIIGFGKQGQVLFDTMNKIPSGIQIKAVCDIWPLKKNYGRNLSLKYGHKANAYEDYREMLSKEKDLHCVIVATPDFMHAEHTNASLQAGCHVYCEKLMSNTIEGARSMVKTQRDTGKLLQIGHQRRSNPRYVYVKERLLNEAQLLGKITTVNGQWNRAVTLPDKKPPKIKPIDPKTLEKYGYANMHEFLNWRWYKRYGGGPISDLGAHQIDIYNWFLGNNPTSIVATGGVDYYPDHEWYDNVMVVYDFPSPTGKGKTRAFYQVQTTTSAGGGYFEYFMGTEGAIRMSENPKYTRIYQEASSKWDKWQDSELVLKYNGERPWEKRASPLPPKKMTTVDVRETPPVLEWNIPIMLGDKSIHQYHLENFFDSVRGEDTLNCPAEVAYASTVTVLAANQAVASEQKRHFNPKDFII